MEIRIETGYSQGRMTVDISLESVDITSLPSLNGDEIREVVRPIIENKLFLENGNRGNSRKLSYQYVYGKERCRESFPGLFDSGQESESSRSSQ